MKWIKGDTVVRSLPRTASVTFTAGTLVRVEKAVGTLSTAGNATSTGIVGIILESVASTDGDYATAAVEVLVDVPVGKDCVLLATVANGSLLTTSIGQEFALSTTSGNVDFGDTSTTAVRCVKFVSATEGQFVIEQSALLDD